jgi:hypothetical protein
MIAKLPQMICDECRMTSLPLKNVQDSGSLYMKKPPDVWPGVKRKKHAIPKSL